MKSKIPILVFIASLAFIVACEDDETVVDVESPTITIEEPVNSEAFPAGGILHFEALFEDNEQLATFNIAIHDNFDGHSHGRIAVTPFRYEQSFELTGKAEDVHKDIPVPADATAGPYHLTVEALDAEGNSTSFAEGTSRELEIWITNEEMSHVHFQSASGTEVELYEGVVGEPLQFYGEIEDGSGTLDHVTIIVGHLEEVSGHNHDHDNADRVDLVDNQVYEEDFEVTGETFVMIQDLLAEENIVVNQEHLDALEEGEHLHLVVIVRDSDGNISRNFIEIHFD